MSKTVDDVVVVTEHIGPMTARFTPAIWVGLAASAAMLIGAFGPWAKALFVSVNGTDGSNDGWLVVAAAVVGAFSLVGYSRNAHAGFAILAALAGGTGAIVTIYDRNNLSGTDDDSEFEGIVQIGWGLNLAMAASIALAVAAVVVGHQGRKRLSTDVEPGTVPPQPPE